MTLIQFFFSEFIFFFSENISTELDSIFTEFDSVKTTAVVAKVQKEIYFLKRMKPSSKTISPLSSIRRRTATVFLSER